MKVKCIRLLDAYGHNIEFSPWLTLGRIYHVMAVEVGTDGRRRFGIVTHHVDGEWPQLGSHQDECFEVVSSVVPSNWREWKTANASGLSPASWQEASFYEGFFEHDPATYPIFERERDVILREDP